jgi:hypothetical protein
MKDLLNLISSILICWSHGFSTKTGAELFLLEAAQRENRAFKRGSQRNPKTEARDLQRKYAARLNVRR